MKVESWLTVRTAITILRFCRPARSAATTLDFPEPVGASIIAIPPALATCATTSSMWRWPGRYSLYGKKVSKLSISLVLLAAECFMGVGRGGEDDGHAELSLLPVDAVES